MPGSQAGMETRKHGHGCWQWPWPLADGHSILSTFSRKRVMKFELGEPCKVKWWGLSEGHKDFSDEGR